MLYVKNYIFNIFFYLLDRKRRKFYMDIAFFYIGFFYFFEILFKKYKALGQSPRAACVTAESLCDRSCST